MKQSLAILLVLLVAACASRSAPEPISRGLAPVREKWLIADKLTVANTTNLQGAATFDDALTVAGLTTLNGGLALDGTSFTVANTTGNTLIGGTLAVVGASTLGGDITLTDEATGGNGGAANTLSANLNFALVPVAGTNGAAAGKTLALMDDTPDGEWPAHDADTTVTADAALFRVGSKSLKIAFTAAADAGDGAHDAVAYDFSADESVGFWMYCDSLLAAGDVVFDMTDDGGHHAIDIPAMPAGTTGVWRWYELNIGAIADADKNVISDISFELSAAGAAKAAAGAFYCAFDGAWKWDSTEEAALGQAIVARGVKSVLVQTTEEASHHTFTALTENTDYLTHYETGNDFIVWITDQSAVTGFAAILY